MTQEFGVALEVFVGSGMLDSKGREIGWTVGLNDDGQQFAAWVQSSRKQKGEFKDFGVPQRSLTFATQEAATNWAYGTAHERVNALSRPNRTTRPSAGA